jgi:hypothetical protein
MCILIPTYLTGTLQRWSHLLGSKLGHGEAIHELVGSEPVIVTGAFNAEMDERGPQHFLQSGFKLAVNEWVDSPLDPRKAVFWGVLDRGILGPTGVDARGCKRFDDRFHGMKKNKIRFGQLVLVSKLRLTN